MDSVTGSSYSGGRSIGRVAQRRPRRARTGVVATVVGMGIVALFNVHRLEAQKRTATVEKVVALYPGDNLQLRVAAAPAGTSFVLKAGLHRLQSIRPKDGDVFTGEAGTVLSGARLLTAFTRSGKYWVAGGQTQQGVVHGTCEAAFPRCNFPEQVFIDDRLLQHAASLGEVEPGTFFFDYAADRIYLGEDPSGHRVETSVLPTAFEPTGDNVTVTGITVEKYASVAQAGAISADGRSGWLISRNEVRWNHGLGIRIGEAAKILTNQIHHNGQLGIGGEGSDVLVEGNTIAYNNTAHFDAYWEGGGSKFVRTDRLTVRANTVHHNFGPGLWTDIDNINTVYENNVSEDNDGVGIFHEISYAAVIRDNMVRRNGFGYSTWIWGSGILVAASRDVEVVGNTVEGNADGICGVQQNRGGGAYGPYEVSNLWVHDNVIAMDGGTTGFVQDIGDTSYFTSRNNRFERNSYQLGSAGAYFAWMNAERSESEWKSYGQDKSGTFRR